MGWIVFAALVVLLLGIASIYLTSLEVDACRALGYPDALFALDGTTYCSGTIRGTSRVVPLEKAPRLEVVVE